MSKPDLSLPGAFKLGHTCKFCVIDVAGSKPCHIPEGMAAGGGGGAPGRDKTRLTKESGARSDGAAKLIGGPFTRQGDAKAPFLSSRTDVFDACKARREAELVASPPDTVAISITLPDGAVKEGVAWQTTPLDIASAISSGLVQHCICAAVTYPKGARASAGGAGHVMSGGAPDGIEDEDGEAADAGGSEAEEREMWDMSRPLEGDCKLELLKWDNDEAKTVFWHSSAHVLGEAMEHLYGCYLTIGPPVDPGFYYDSFMGDTAIAEADYKNIEGEVKKVVKNKQKFERLIVTKDEALEMFAYNPFKHQLISAKVSRPVVSRRVVSRRVVSRRVVSRHVLHAAHTGWMIDSTHDS
jgi:threonyl-tRNA synthetase